MNTEYILEIVKSHGEDVGPEAEVGDLEEILRVAWAMLPAHTDLGNNASISDIFEAADSDEVDGTVVDAETVIRAAEIHGSYDDPDHQVGDLQDALRAVWRNLDKATRATFTEHPTIFQTLNAARTTADTDAVRFPASS